MVRFDGPEIHTVRSRAVAVDSAGNVYLAATSTGAGSRYDSLHSARSTHHRAQGQPESLSHGRLPFFVGAGEAGREMRVRSNSPNCQGSSFLP